MRTIQDLSAPSNPSTILNSPGMMGTPSLMNMQNMLQFQLLGHLKTGDIIYDTLISYVIFLVMGNFVTKVTSWIGQLYSFIIRTMRSIGAWSLRRTKNCVRGAQVELIDRTVTIDYITDNKQYNELYNAVSWYLMTAGDIDFLHEGQLQFSCTDRITAETAKAFVPKISKRVHDHLIKEIIFNKQKITYRTSSELIKIFTDRERQRENYQIKLYAEVDKYAQSDILEEFCNHCITLYAQSMITQVWKQQIYVNDVEGKWTGRDSKNRRKIDTVILRGDLKEEIRKDLQMFLNSLDWYHTRDIPYTRGYLFYGPPGTGKTTMIKALANVGRRHIHYLVLTNVKSDAQLLTLLKSIDYEQTILVIEDIDCMSQIVRDRALMRVKAEEAESDEEIEERRRVRRRPSGNHRNPDEPNYKKEEYVEQTTADEYQLTLSGLLNAIDGIFTVEGRILIMTSNHPEQLDSALLRPGRIDRKFLFDNCDRDQIQELYTMFYGHTCPPDLLASIRDQLYSPAHVTSILLRYRDSPQEALKHLNDEEDRPFVQSMITGTT